MATTSGTVGQTQIDVVTFIEHAFRRCGKLAPTISGELLLSARQNLFFLLSDLANRGLSLWCIKKSVLPVEAYKTTYVLPTGTVDLLNALYRTTTLLSGTTSLQPTYAQLDLATAQLVNTLGITFATDQTLLPASLIIESSADALTWRQRGIFGVTGAVSAGQLLLQDVDNTATSRYWRVRSTSTYVPNAISAWNNPLDIPMAKLDRDSYVNLPNKGFSVPSGSRSLQYWYDKQINPQIDIWPVSQGAVDQIVAWTQRQMQDVGDLSNLVEVPQRWNESILLLLAHRCSLEIPPQELPPGRTEMLKALSDEHLQQAEDSERDGSPIRLAPNIRGYTR